MGHPVYTKTYESSFGHFVTEVPLQYLATPLANLHCDRKKVSGKKYFVEGALFINKRFALNEMFQQNASKFAIFYVDIDQGIHKVKI